jgi:acyl carrier protein
MSLETVKLIFVNRYGVSTAELSADSQISELCTDSLEILELLMYIEDEFNITFPDEIAQEFKSLGDIAEYMDSNIPDEAVEKIYKKLQAEA